MPTGYTDAVRKGEITDFPEFAMQCARAMGACIMLRDEPLSTPIPDEFKPRQWSAERLAKAKAELAKVESYSLEQCAERAHDEYGAEVQQYQQVEAERNLDQERYEAMLAKVRQWEPPTSDHSGFKDFMIEQLEGSIDFDCSMDCYPKPRQLDAIQWKSKELERLKRDIAYHTKAQREEEERTEARNRWLRELRRSLANQ